MMDRAPMPARPFELAPAYQLERDRISEQVTMVTIQTASGGLAARGLVGLLGDVAIPAA